MTTNVSRLPQPVTPIVYSARWIPFYGGTTCSAFLRPEGPPHSDASCPMALLIASISVSWSKGFRR